jgi:RimJ/RimL family protein N-acetyltransferase
MIVLETERLLLRRFTIADAAFILEILNDPAFLQNVGDRKIRTVEDAENYLSSVMIKSYTQYGFGFYLVTLKATGQSIGTCGLVKRDALEHVDIGYAFLPAFRSRGYAYEAAAAVKVHAKDVAGLDKLVAIVNPSNQISIRILEKLGMKFDRMVKMSEVESEIRMYSRDL